MREVKEWVGANDNTAIPPRVKLRVAARTLDCCQQCGRKVGGALRAQFDHVVPLCLGGENKESNIALVCHECHLGKTKLDVKLKAKVARVRCRHLGIRPKSRFACSKDSPYRKKVNGLVVPR